MAGEDIRVKIGGDIKGLDAALRSATRSVDGFVGKARGSFKSLTGSVFGLQGAIIGMVAAFGGFKLLNYIKDVSRVAGQYEMLGIVMRQSGKVAGATTEYMDYLEDSLKRTGIAGIEARQVLSRMAATNMDLTKATQLARAAQDLAVVGSINSSEAYERLIHGIQTGHVIILRTLGLHVNFEKSYERAAKAIGKTTEQLTEQEKVQIRTNEVLRAGAGYQGIYEKSMTSAEKQMNSMVRYIQAYKIAFGQAFQPAYLEIVKAKTEIYKTLTAVMSNPAVRNALEEMSKKFSVLYTKVAEWAAVNAEIIAQDFFGWLAKKIPSFETVIEKIKSLKDALATVWEYVKLVDSQTAGLGLAAWFFFGRAGGAAVIASMIAYKKILETMFPADMFKARREELEAEKKMLESQLKGEGGSWLNQLVPVPLDSEQKKIITDRLNFVKAQLGLFAATVKREAKEAGEGNRLLALAMSVEGLAGSRLPPAPPKPKIEPEERTWENILKKMGTSVKEYDKLISEVSKSEIEGFEANRKALIDYEGDKFKLRKDVTDKTNQLTLSELDYKLWALGEEKRNMLLVAGSDMDLRKQVSDYHIGMEKKTVLESKKNTKEWLDYHLKIMGQNGATLQELAQERWDHTLKYSQDAYDGMRVAMEQFTENYETEAQRAHRITLGVANSIRDNFTDAFTGVIMGTKKAKDAFRDMAMSIITDLIKIQIKEAATKSLAGIGGSIFGALTGMFTPVFEPHRGGVIGKTSIPTRMMDSSIFAHAPRLHKGLKNDEYPAILQRGEEVISKDKAGGKGGTVHYYNFDGATFLDQEQLGATMRTIAANAVYQLAPAAIIKSYENDADIRTLIRGGR